MTFYDSHAARCAVSDSRPSYPRQSFISGICPGIKYALDFTFYDLSFHWLLWVFRLY